MNMFDYHKTLVDRQKSIRKRNIFGTTKLKNEKDIKFLHQYIDTKKYSQTKEEIQEFLRNAQILEEHRKERERKMEEIKEKEEMEKKLITEKRKRNEQC